MKTRILLGLVVVWVVLYGGNVWGFTESGNNNFFGVGAGNSNTTGGANSFVGGYAGYSNTTANNNSFLGYQAGGGNTTGHDNSFIGGYGGYSNTTGGYNSFLGTAAGYLNTTGSNNSFIGYEVGRSNTTGNDNSFLGYHAGYLNTIGINNTFLGSMAGYLNTTGGTNTYLGYAAGYYNSTGSGNVFLGYAAGYTETGSNKLYIDSFSTSIPLIYGEFDNKLLRINGRGHFSGLGVSESQLHFSLDNTDTGGWITSVLDNNFFLSSGAMYDQLAGGWVQKSPDGKAVIAGSGSTGYRVQTRTGCAVGTVCSTPVTRLMIDYSGNVGLGVTAPTHPLQLAGGAYSDGANWIDASSRAYKDNIRDLTTEEALSAFQGLNPVAFTFKTGGGDQHVGFIAEDVPELVATKDRKGLSPMDIVAVLTKVVKEQQAIIDTQQKTNQEQQTLNIILMKKLVQLEDKIEDLQARGNPISILSQK